MIDYKIGDYLLSRQFKTIVMIIEEKMHTSDNVHYYWLLQNNDLSYYEDKISLDEYYIKVNNKIGKILFFKN